MPLPEARVDGHFGVVLFAGFHVDFETRLFVTHSTGVFSWL